jgi:hypothetical protein
MGRSYLNKTEQELYSMWEYIRKVCIRKKSKVYEGVPCEEKWLTFEGFVKDNWFRYLRAKVKWQNYKRVSVRKVGEKPAPLKINNVKLKRKVMSDGYTKENTVFTSPSDMMKYYDSTHKYMFENRLLGTRDIKNILKKRGIDLTMETIVSRLNNGLNLFQPSEQSKIKYKGKFRSYVEIAKMENISFDLLKKKNYEVNDIRKAVDYCRNWDGYPTYEFEGKQLRKFEICEIISKSTNIDRFTIEGRFTKYGMNLEFLTAPLSAKLTMRKNIFALRDDGEELSFESIADAARKLNIPDSNISQAANGKVVHAGGYKFRFDGCQYNNSPIETYSDQLAKAREKMVKKSKERHECQTRHCEICNQDKDKKHFNVSNFKRCKECISKASGIVNIGQHQERKEMFDKGFIFCSDCKDYKPLAEFYKSSSHHTGYFTICKQHSNERVKLRKQIKQMA